jgi:hypothetical protein
VQLIQVDQQLSTTFACEWSALTIFASAPPNPWRRPTQCSPPEAHAVKSIRRLSGENPVSRLWGGASIIPPGLLVNSTDSAPSWFGVPWFFKSGCTARQSGTEGSNPSPSRRESTANLTAAAAGEEIPAPHFDGPLRTPRLITELAAAVPEPASIALLSAGLLSLVAEFEPSIPGDKPFPKSRPDGRRRAPLRRARAGAQTRRRAGSNPR